MFFTGAMRTGLGVPRDARMGPYADDSQVVEQTEVCLMCQDVADEALAAHPLRPY